MYDELHLKWQQYHNDPHSRKELQDFVYDSWERCISLKINPINAAPYICENNEFNRIKTESKILYIDSNYVLEKMYKYIEHTDFGFALFNKEGCLLKLYGNEKFLTWAKSHKLETRSIWNENIIGTNAVSLAYKFKKPISVVGEDHFSKFATNMAVYFSPIMSKKGKGNEIIHGGIAIIGPANKNNSAYLITAIAISREISLQFFWFEAINAFSSVVEGYGFISLDQSMGKNRIIYSSKNIFKILNIPYKNLYYNALEEIIDPPPKNTEFWEIITKKMNVTDYLIKLSISGKQIPISISTDPFYEKNFHVEGITISINSTKRINSIISKHSGNNARYTFADIIGHSENYLNSLNHAKTLASSDINILLLGESGVGKDILAQAIHNASSRKNGPFIAVNCAALPKDLIASELFGYDEGAFTGAKKGGNIGKFQLADGGTLFLDEIGDMPLDLQATILRAIENKSFMQVGGNTQIKVDIRIISATNVNLFTKMKQKQFREDLFYRLGVMRINIAPLRERQEDILLLTEHFIRIICNRINKPLVSLSSDAKKAFLNYRWPGNVRELQNTLEGIIQVYDTNIITQEHIENYISMNRVQKSYNDSRESYNSNKNIVQDKINQQSIKAHIPNTRDYIVQALELNNNNKTKTAEYLNISRRTLYRRLKKYNLL